MGPSRPPVFIQEARITRAALPHVEEPGATYYVTICLQRPPALSLAQHPIGDMLVGALKHHDGDKYHLFDYTVMPDHVHAILKPLRTDTGWHCLARLLYDLKQFTARDINSQLGRTGHVWQAESHDHILRNRDDYEEKAQYILQNAYAKGLIDDPTRWPWWGKGSGAAL